MKQIDFITEPADSPVKPFRDIRNTRFTVADEKATLVLELGRLARKVPAKISSGSIQITRQWMEASKKAMSVASNQRSSVTDLTLALKTLRAFES